MAKRIVHVPGEKIGRLTFVVWVPTDTTRKRALFQCDCGNTHEARASHWRYGKITSCGCYLTEVRYGRKTTHGMTGTPLYYAWASMRSRVTPHYYLNRPNYKGVGCDPCWRTFEGFVANPPAGEFEPGMVLARYGDVGDYTPSNCRWATKAENTREANERKMHRLPDGRFALDVARENGLTASCFWDRMQTGWPMDLACTAPKGTRRARA